MLTRLQRGDRAAFTELIDQFSSTVYGIALRVAGDPKKAAAVTVTVFERLWLRPHELVVAPAIGALRAELARRARAAARRDRHDRRRDVRPTRDAPVDHAALPDGTESRHAEAARARTLTCLDHLEPTDRHILEPVVLDGDSIDEAAARIPMPVEAAATRLTSALRRLAELDAAHDKQGATS